jgi:hypothetical protein
MRRRLQLTMELQFHCVTDSGDSFQWRSVLYFPPAVRRFDPVGLVGQSVRQAVLSLLPSPYFAG